MSKGTNPGILIPGPTEASPAVRTALQQIVTKFGMLSKPILNGLTIGSLSGVLKATGGVVAGSAAHGDLGGVTANQHHNQVHVLDSSDHTVSGLTTGHVLQALSATTFGFAALSTHDAVTVTGAPLTLSGQQITFNYDGTDFQLSGNNLQVKDGGIDHGGLAGVSANQHHNQAHVLDGGDHTVSGLTAGHVLQALTATTFGFAAVPGLGSGDTPSFTGLVLIGVANETARLALDVDYGSVIYQQDTGELYLAGRNA